MPDNAAVAFRLARGFAPHEAGVGHGAYEAKLVVLFFFSSTSSAANMSVPGAIPVMNVVYPSAIARSITSAKSGFISSSEYLSFSGRCPVKQQQCKFISFCT